MTGAQAPAETERARRGRIRTAMTGAQAEGVYTRLIDQQTEDLYTAHAPENIG